MNTQNMYNDSDYPFTSPYPKPQYNYPTSYSRTSVDKTNARVSSPTPSELEEVNEPFFPRKFLSLQFYKRPKVILLVMLFIVIGVFTILLTVFHTQIEDWLRPAATWMKDLKFGWLIPIAILFVISFPPLFGHEVVAVLAGNVWGLWEGFGIVAAGTLVGEIGNFYAFKYICQARASKAETSSWWYACLARTVREGGFLVAVMARLSVIPGHFTTAVFATCGMNIFVFTLAAILSLPKQFITVYLGVLLEQSADPSQQNNKSKIISDVVVVISVLVTAFAMHWILKKMKAQRIYVVRERRARLGKGNGTLSQSLRDESSTSLIGRGNDVFNPAASEADLHAPGVAPSQRWDHPGHTADAGYDNPFENGAYGAYPPPPVQVSAPSSYAPAPEPAISYSALNVPPRFTSPSNAGHQNSPYSPEDESRSYPSNDRPIPWGNQQHLGQTVEQPLQPYDRKPPFDQKASSPPLESPFEDSHAIKIPAHVPRYQLSDTGFQTKALHTSEATESSFQTASDGSHMQDPSADLR